MPGDGSDSEQLKDLYGERQNEDRYGTVGTSPWSQAWVGGQAQLGSAQRSDVGPPSCGSTTRRGLHGGQVPRGLGGSRVPQRPGPRTQHLAVGTWNIPRWGKEPELMWEVERFPLNIVGLTSTHSLGSNTQLPRGTGGSTGLE